MSKPTIEKDGLQYVWHTNSFPASGDGTKITENPDGSLTCRQPSGASWHYTKAVLGPPLKEGDALTQEAVGIYKAPDTKIKIRDKKGRFAN
jgi:hypothetical protein